MYDPDQISLRSEHMFTLTLSSPVAGGDIPDPEDYNSLKNKPSLNGVELIGDVSLQDIGFPDLSGIPREALTTIELDEITSSP